MVVVETPSEGKPSMGKSIRNFASVTRVGLDLAKRVFQVHAVDANGDLVVARKLTRGQLIPFFAALPPCVVAMEACASAHHWGRALIELRHEVRLLPPAHVKPYVRRNKNDSALRSLVGQIDALDEAIGAIDRELAASVKADETAKRLMTIPGVGPVTASAITATIQDAGAFASGREFAAFLGLTPRQNSTGGKTRLGRITKMGDRYLRKLLVVGACATLRHRRGHNDALRLWASGMLERKTVKYKFNLTAVALANKVARIVFVLMTRGGQYDGRPVAA